MSQKTLFTKVCSAVAVALILHPCLVGRFSVKRIFFPGLGRLIQGRCNADDAGNVSRNPLLITMFLTARHFLRVVYIDPDVNISEPLA